jgi:hypothetical protein
LEFFGKGNGYEKNPKNSFNNPKIQIQMYVDTKDEIPKVAIFTQVGRKPIFNKIMEEVSVEYILTIEEQYFFSHKADVRMTALQLANKSNLNSSSVLTERMCWKRLNVNVLSRRKN